MVERSDERMERSGLERSGHGTKWPKDGTKWFGTKRSWNEVTGYRGELLPGKGGGVGSCCLFRRQGANCCIPVEMEEMLTYIQLKNAETFAAGQSRVANSPCTLSTNLD